MNGGEKRLDLCVMELRGFSREYAAEVIKDGGVLVKGVPERKPGRKASPGDVEVLAGDMPFVSRGGLKLQGALEGFGIDVAGLVCLDAGASTGGFTDCMLKRGAARVYAVDVGHGQLAKTLQANPRVLAYEQTDIRGLTLPEAMDFAAVDLSFIALKKAAPSVAALLKPGGKAVCLIKPEFETEGKGLTKRGVVKSDKLRGKAREAALAALGESGLRVVGQMESPIKGGDGNVEYLAFCVKEGPLSF